MANTTQKQQTKTTAKKSPATKTATKGSRGQKVEAAQDNVILSDFDIASDILGNQKTLIEKYGQAICEISCPTLRKIVSSQMSECASDQLDCFNYMHERGMYKTEAAPANKIKQAKQKYAGVLNKSSKPKR